MRLLSDFYNESPTKTKTRAKIVMAATKIFSYEGIEGATVTDIAKASGITTRNLYRYYPSIEYLVVDVAYQRIFVDTKFEELGKGEGSAVSRIRSFITQLYEWEKLPNQGLSYIRFIMYFDLYISKLDQEHPAYIKYVDVYREEINSGAYEVLADLLYEGIHKNELRIKDDEVDFYVVFIVQSLMSVVMRTIVKEAENPTINESLVYKQIEMIIEHISNN